MIILSEFLHNLKENDNDSRLVTIAASDMFISRAQQFHESEDETAVISN